MPSPARAEFRHGFQLPNSHHHPAHRRGHVILSNPEGERRMDSMDEKENLNSSLFSRRSFLATSLMALPSLKALSAISRAPKADQNWPEFRGPGARGVANGYPTRASWNVDSSSCKTSGLLWRIDVPGLSHSSPIIWGDQLFIATVVKLSGKATLRTGYYGDVRTAKDNDEQKCTVLCFDKKTGKKRWEHTV